ncbi:hypothetical protein ACVCAH_31110 [Micromonospora sp. LZ34]
MVTEVRIAIGIAGLLLLATPFLLPRRTNTQPASEPPQPSAAVAR